MDSEELKEIKEKLMPFMVSECGRHDITRVYFMLTNILTESTELICQGQGAIQLAAKAFHLDIEEAAQQEEPVLKLPGVVSRKKQLIPELVLAEQD